jgi:hypothetical protein
MRQPDGTTRAPVTWGRVPGCQRRRRDDRGAVGGGVKRATGRLVDVRLLALLVGLTIEHELVGGGLQPVDGGLGEQGVGHEPQPLSGVLRMLAFASS